jgi:murein DD-endopeptidase MepM/ murein hydrolase activator NlpD
VAVGLAVGCTTATPAGSGPSGGPGPTSAPGGSPPGPLAAPSAATSGRSTTPTPSATAQATLNGPTRVPGQTGVPSAGGPGQTAARSTSGSGPSAVPSAVAPDPSAAASARGYTFPVRPAADASFGATHHDYPATDVFAPCGDAFVAPTSGMIVEVSTVDRWDPGHDRGATRGGLSITLGGADGVRYYGSHLRRIAPGLRPGTRVRTGTPLGVVGRTGNARFTSCHVHFGISPACRLPGEWWIRRGVVSPWPYLTSWRSGGQRSPVTEVGAWRRAHGCPRAPAPGSG